MKLTTRTITDEQIIALRNATSEHEVKRLCNLALLAPGGVGMKHEYEEARWRCAEMLNARKVTAATITDEQIRELMFDLTVDSIDRDIAELALYPEESPSTRVRTQARARCAEILNAREDKS